MTKKLFTLITIGVMMFIMSTVASAAIVFTNPPTSDTGIITLVNAAQKKYPGETCVIKIEKSIDIGNTITIPSGVSIIIRRTASAGSLQMRVAKPNLPMFIVEEGGSLEFRNNISSSAFYIQGTNGTATTNKRTVPLISVNGTVTIGSNIVFNRTALTETGVYGSVFCVNNGGVLNMNGGTIKNNTATGLGGAIAVLDGGNFNMNGGTLSGNTAIYSEDISSSGNGGAIAVLGGGTVNLNGGTISGNTASTNGGAVYVQNGGTVNLGAVNIKNNTAVKNGGGVYSIGGNTTVGDVLMSGNTAAAGNGIYTVNSTSTTSSFTLGGQPTINDDICIKAYPAKIASDFAPTAAVPITLTKPTTSAIFKCEDSSADYSDSLSISGFTTEGYDAANYAFMTTQNGLVLTQKYTITYLDYDGSILSTESVWSGNDGFPPTPSDRDSYVFVGWDGDYTNVTEDRILRPVYKKADTIELYADGEQTDGTVKTENGKTVSISAAVYTEKSAKLILAEYRSGKLVGITDGTADDNFKLTVSKNVSANSGTTLKAMLWIADGSLTPICAAQGVTFEETAE